MRAGARPVAGGTDLVVGARQGKAALPDALVAIHGLAELHGIAELPGGGLRIGALVSHARPRRRTRPCASRFTALADASAIVGSHATRHVGTIGGNVMNASPAMETGGPLMCLGAEAVLRSAAGERRRRARGALDRARAAPPRSPTSCSSRSSCPRRRPRSGSCYVRLEYRRQMEIAVVGATCSVALDGSRVADGAGGDHRARAHASCAFPRPRPRWPDSDGGAERSRAAGAAAAAAARPISDVRASADYRRAMAR